MIIRRQSMSEPPVIQTRGSPRVSNDERRRGIRELVAPAVDI
jgi:hypothetical protein